MITVLLPKDRRVTIRLDFSSTGWGRVILTTILGSLLCTAITIGVAMPNLIEMTDEMRSRVLIATIFLPLNLAAPLLFFFTAKLRDLAIAHRQLTIFAATDSLTQVMSRSAFSTLVEAYLNEMRAHEQDRHGALLIVDADNFKSINDTYGHAQGDEALIAIARAIKEVIRAPDLVGRLGGEEFGIFLPGAGTDQASRVAERICHNVHAVAFTPAGTVHPLSVSVGGAVFESKLPFKELFRAADQQLYAAKLAGRDRASIRGIGSGETLAAA